MEIRGETKVLGIFGYPVKHTFSPLIHNAAFKDKGLNYVYLPFEVKPEHLKQATEAIIALDLMGVNVTVPHKEAIISFLDEVSEDALLSGAVNTVHNRNGSLIGYNTDGEGYIRSLKNDTGFDPGGKNIVILGAGGAAKGILASLAGKLPEKIIIFNRTQSRAARLVMEFQKKFPGLALKSVTLDDDKLKRYLQEAHLFINATTMGMDGRGSIGVPLESLPKDGIVSDIVYKPLNTPLIRHAESLGFKTHRGLGMLLEQAVLSFKIWTGIDAPADVMKSVLLEKLCGTP
jgi:shikimate dehydrogenase